MRKFIQSEIDLIYNKLKPDEEILWRGKPSVVPNIGFMTTLLFVFLGDILFIVLHYLSIDNHHFASLFQDWFSVVLIFIAIGLIVFLVIYADRHYHKMVRAFYVVTSSRLVIFDSHKGRIRYAKLYPMIKLLRLKKTIFDSGSVIFDIDIVDERIVEIGFIHIDEAEKVLEIIKNQLNHTRNRE